MLAFNYPITPPSPPITRFRRLVSFSPKPPEIYPPAVPNLELHSAAASGNVGLVHYALTHGQPVNSVLHGVLPLHAACSGGSVSVVRMLIERGADVNAPRLPRRYSENRTTTAPSVGASGSTPLHFAAANGHAGIVQILLTCGAIPDKPDKNGLTPEALAEINGHSEVIRVLRVYEHLQFQDAQSQFGDDDALSTYGQSSVGDFASRDPSIRLDDEEDRYGSRGSRKGKERAMSFSSNLSDGYSLRGLRIKKSVEGFFRSRGSRSASFASSLHMSEGSPGKVPPVSSLPGSDHSPGRHDSTIDLNSPSSPTGYSGDGFSLGRTFSGASGGSSNALARVTSPASIISGTSTISMVAQMSGPSGLPMPQVRRTSHSSRRPSLPSIFEKATHPAATFRAAMRRDGENPNPNDSALSPTSPSSISPPRTSHSRGFFRGRHRSNDSAPSSSSSIKSGKHSHRYMSKHSLTSLFRRGNQSPPSRSPSPPRRARVDSSKIIGSEELDEGIERLNQASLDLDRKAGVDDPRPGALSPTPASAPAIKTKFFEDSGSNSPLPPLDLALLPRGFDDRGPLSAASTGKDRPWNRHRTTSEVIAPSPLANEWALSSDSDSPSPRGMRRAKTEMLKMKPFLTSPKRSNPSSPLGSGYTKPRSATLPGSGGGWQGWEEDAGGVELRKIASSARMREREVEVEDETEREAETETETETEVEEVFHDAEGGDEGTVSVLGENVRTGEDLQVGLGAVTDGPSVVLAETEPSGETIPIGQETRGDLTPTAGNEPLLPQESLTEHTESLVPADSPAIEKSQRAEKRSMLSVTIPDYAQHDEQRFILQDPPKTSAGPRRFRGASIGSVTSVSSRMSAGGGSSLRMSLINSDENSSHQGSPSKLHLTPPPPLPSFSSDGRARGKSVSSTSSNTSGLAYSYNLPSTPGTSLTPQSTLSMQLHGFPPVPEDEALSSPPPPRRKFSTRAEAAEVVKQAEDDILLTATLPLSLDSSRSLAAQLAAYGENHAMEEELAERERLGWRRGSEVSSSEGGDSFVSARSDAEGMGLDSRRGSGQISIGSGRRSRGPPSLISIDAPKSSVPSINNIYDKRAAAYRKHMTALTSSPPTLPASSASSTHSRRRGHRAVTTGNSWPRSSSGSAYHEIHEEDEEDLNQTPRPVQASHMHTHNPGPIPIRDTGLIPPPPFKKPPSSLSRVRTPSTHSQIRPLSPRLQCHSASYTNLSRTNTNLSTLNTIPTPIAGVLSTRYQGLPPPSIVGSGSNGGHISIFSSRYAGNPKDGDDSDDSGEEGARYTLVENEWTRMGKRAGGMPIVEGSEVGMGSEGLKKPGWGGKIRGKIGHIGRK